MLDFFFDQKKFFCFAEGQKKRKTKFKTVAELLITRRHICVRLEAAGFIVVLDEATIQSSVKIPSDIALTLQFHEKKQTNKKYCQNEK